MNIQSPPNRVLGLRVQGQQLRPQFIIIDPQFIKCPIAHAAGIPLYVKRILNVERKKFKRYAIVRMMSQPKVGLSPNHWQYGGMLLPAPPVLVARSDGIEFEGADWKVLDDFEMQMLDDGPRQVSRKDFIKFVKQNFADDTSNIVLEALYPMQTNCKVYGLIKRPELNGKVGTCVGTYQKGQVGIRLQGYSQVFGIKRQNLQILQSKMCTYNDHSKTKILPGVVCCLIDQQIQPIWLQKRFYPDNNRFCIYGYDYPDLYDIITYNLPHEEISYDQIIVPVSDRHIWKNQLLRYSEYFEDTDRRIKTGYIDCQVWRLKKVPKEHRKCMISNGCTCEKEDK